MPARTVHSRCPGPERLRGNRSGALITGVGGDGVVVHVTCRRQDGSTSSSQSIPWLA